MNQITGNNNRKKRYQRTVFWVAPVVLLTIAFLLWYKPPFYVIRQGAQDSFGGDLLLSGYDDRAHKGNSWLVIEQGTPDKVGYRYILKEGFSYPYVGIMFSREDSSLFDLSSYDYLKINIKARTGTRVPFTLTSEIPSYSNREEHLSYRNSQYVLTVENQFTEISAPLKKFETPDWWYANHNKTEKDLGAPDFSRIRTIQLGNCINLKKETEDVVEVEELSFHVNYWSFFINAGIFLVIYAVGGWLFFRKKEEEKPEINFQYEKIQAVNYRDKEEAAVFGFITSHYSNSELTITDVQSATGIHERKISSMIRKKTDLNFKQFLNKLRISEAKRLLSETDLPVSEIAFKVGYGNASHFNRVFKAAEDRSPNDYRKDPPSV